MINSDSKTNSNQKIYIMMTFAAVFWAGAFIAGKLGVNEFTPLELTFLRFLFASIIIFTIMINKEKDWMIKKEDIGIVILTGLIGMVGYHLLFFKSLQYTTAVNASIIAATNPILTTLLAVIFAGEKINIKKAILIIIAFVGVILTLTNWDISIIYNFSFNIGDIIMLSAVFCWALYTILVKNIVNKYSPLILTTYCFIICTAIVCPFAVYGGIVTKLARVSLVSWASVIYMAIFPSVIGYLIQQISIQKIGASKSSLFVNLVPVFSVILAYFVLNEVVGVLRIISGGIIIAAVILIQD